MHEYYRRRRHGTPLSRSQANELPVNFCVPMTTQPSAARCVRLRAWFALLPFNLVEMGRFGEALQDHRSSLLKNKSLADTQFADRHGNGDAAWF